MTAVFPITLAIAVDPGWGLLLWTVLLFAAIELIVANVVETLIYSRSTGLSAVAVVAAALFWTWLWGIVGLLLATPITVCLVVLGRYIRQLQFLDILLGNRPVLSPQESLYQRLLARDPEEATEQAEEFAREKSIEAFFDDGGGPGAGDGAGRHRSRRTDAAPARRDRRRLCRGARQPGRGRNCRATRRRAGAHSAGRDRRRGGPDRGHRRHATSSTSPRPGCLNICCGRGDTAAAVYAPDALSSFAVDELPLRGVSVICLSLLSANSAAQLRYLVRRLRRRARRARIVIGYWDRRDDADFSVADATAATAADRVVTSLSDALAEIEAALADGQRRHQRRTSPDGSGLKTLIGP